MLMTCLLQGQINIQKINYLKRELSSFFQIKELGRQKYFLGLEFSFAKTGIYMGQCKYVLDLLDSTDYINAKPIKVPASRSESHRNQTKSTMDNTPMVNPLVYRRIVGKLVYLTVTKLDITYAINFLSQHMANPTKDDLQVAHKVLRYIKNSLGLSLFFLGSTTSGIRAFSNSDWASRPSTKRSTTGCAIYLRCSLISSQTKKKHTVVRSSVEAEY